MYKIEERETRELFSVYYWVGESAHIAYIWGYTQEEADNTGRLRGLDVFDATNLK